MPTLNLTVTNEVAARIQTAYGASSLTDLKAKIVEDIKVRVTNYELNAVEEAEQVKVQQAREAMRATIEATQATVQGQIVVS